MCMCAYGEREWGGNGGGGVHVSVLVPKRKTLEGVRSCDVEVTSSLLKG